MESVISVTHSAPVLIFDECYRIIEHFLSRSYHYCLCDMYHGCPTKGDCLTGTRYYCCICRVYMYYSIDELNTVKRDEVKLKNFYLDILKDIEEIKKVRCDNDFWDDEVEFKFRDWKIGKEDRSNFRDSVIFLFNL